jgi:hypothetical protein
VKVNRPFLQHALSLPLLCARFPRRRHLCLLVPTESLRNQDVSIAANAMVYHQCLILDVCWLLGPLKRSLLQNFSGLDSNCLIQFISQCVTTSMYLILALIALAIKWFVLL